MLTSSDNKQKRFCIRNVDYNVILFYIYSIELVDLDGVRTRIVYFSRFLSLPLSLVRIMILNLDVVYEFFHFPHERCDVTRHTHAWLDAS